MLPKALCISAVHQLSVADLQAFAEACANSTGNALLGFQVGLNSRSRGALGLLEFLVRNSSDLRAAILQFSRNYALMNPIVAMELTELPAVPGVSWTLSIPGLTTGPSQQSNEYLLTFLVKVMRDLIGQDFTPRGVFFAHADHPSAEPMKQWFKCPLFFNASQNEIQIDETDLSRPIVGADPTLLPMIETLIADSISTNSARSSWREQVRGMFRQHLTEPGHLQKNIAAALHMTPRTLQRNLKTEGTSFHEELETFRKARILTLLASSQKSINEVAADLGYVDLRAFRRACRRWTGKSPQELRAHLSKGQ
jgi:AraC-like DNA-binding protein